MLTDGEVDRLARDVLSRILTNPRIAETGDFTVRQFTDGELAAFYQATSDADYGAFECVYIPLTAVKKIVIECFKMLRDFTVPTSDGTVLLASEAPLERQLIILAPMADVATMQMLVSLRQRLCESVEDAVEESLLVGRSLVVAAAIQRLKETDGGEVLADARPEIEKAVERAASRRRTLLRDYFKLMPNILAERGRGRTAKSAIERETERSEYIVKVQTTYRELYVKHGKKPKKTLVAKTLGEGGLNPKTGSDSSLQAFRLKLTRLGISYEDIVRAIDEELLNNNS